MLVTAAVALGMDNTLAGFVAGMAAVTFAAAWKLILQPCLIIFKHHAAKIRTKLFGR